LHSGDKYPCTVEATSPDDFKEKSSEELICIFEEGELGVNRKPMRILITNFVYTAGVDLTVSFLYENPAPGIIPVFDLYAFGDSATNTYFSGNKMYGYASFYDINF